MIGVTGQPAMLVEFLARRGCPVPPVTLVDVGCSGGIHPRWRAWGASLTGMGIDMLHAEVERLTRDEVLNIRYVCAQIGCGAGSPRTTHAASSDYALHRSQAYITAMLLGDDQRGTYEEYLARGRELRADQRPREANYSNMQAPGDDPFYRYYAQRFASGQDVRIAEHTTTVDDLVGEEGGLRHVDVIKIDVDGWELDVLRGAERTLSAGTLAVEVEVQFTGLRGPEANIFSNVDTILRSAGLTLVDLQTVRYARAALPQPFLYEIPAQTNRGAVVWADALYLRDILSDGPAGAPAMEKQAGQLTCIADAYGFHDWAAELVLAYPGVFSPVPDSQILDYLASASTGSDTSYEELVSEFSRDPLGYGRRG